MKETGVLIQFPVDRLKKEAYPSQLFREYEQLTSSHNYSESRGEVLRQLDRGNPIARRLIASQIGEEIFKGLQVIKSMGMNLEEVAEIVKEVRSSKGGE